METYMQVKTIGREVFPGAEISLKVYKDLEGLPVVPLHTTYQIIIMEEGTGIMKAGQERLLISAPAIFFVNEEESLELEKSSDRIKLHLIYFHPSVIDCKFSFEYVRKVSREDVTTSEVQDLYWLNPFLLRHGQMPLHCGVSTMAVRRLKYLMDAINEEFDKQQTYLWICRGRSYFLELICYCSTLFGPKSSDMELILDKSSVSLEDILLYIHTNYSSRITLKSLVEQFCLNRTTINEMFKKATGESVISYLIKLRIEASAMMLRDTGMPVKEICYRVGFEDMGHFSRTFKKMKGISPKQYRERNSWMLQFS
jgi:AraC family L-rhamnose operon regulatory protein RhaS